MTLLVRSFLLILLIGLGGCASYPPTSAYPGKQIQGFTVLFDPKLVEQHELYANVLAEIEGQLGRIVEAVPPQPLAVLRKTRIWTELNLREGSAARFHVSADWLRENGLNPEKAGSVEIANARLFVRSKSSQPWALVHELAHAYHLHALNHADQRITEAYQHAVSSRLYESVSYVYGGRRRAYALTNEREYFAELSEAYFGKNDYYPYTRGDLQVFDEVGFRLMQEVWGESLPQAGKP